MTTPSPSPSPRSTAYSTGNSPSSIKLPSPAAMPSIHSYVSIFDDLHARTRAEAIAQATALADGDIGLRLKIESELNAKFDKICEGAYIAMQLTPFFKEMSEDLKSAWYDKFVWDSVYSDEEFPGDDSELEEFKEWFFTRLEDADEDTAFEYSGAVKNGKAVEDDKAVKDDGAAKRGAMVDGHWVGDGESEDRYADGETESTDGGAKLSWD
ncbi:uncharacterized protein LY89DRAFT_673014 [Mollisia scopiformis]|uniref:Uncharacterized protein n=1 Tax=Mollisia scopiformis TaxID=149040 RepID=A0A194WY57_MOLSC|nr:uncharacterized protein LY89DRAFT_673014 [Mollisia scopiformis]KUJ12908.1 hypothetical protein LY89DRAFT_673014 [Mollisia scopiformis]